MSALEHVVVTRGLSLVSRIGCLALLACAAAGCAVKDKESEHSADGSADSNGANAEATREIVIDGSSTVFPITQAVAEEFGKEHRGVHTVVGQSGTGGGFKKFVVKETLINDASRPISETEIEECRKNGVEYIELKIAIDGLSVIVHPENDWCDCLTVEQLRAIWRPNSEIQNWNQINPQWPNEKIRLFGPDTDSGTFDYFTEEICGKTGAIRPDYTPSTDDNVLVRGVSQEKYSLGYFGYAYYAEQKTSLKLLGISPEGQPDKCIKPDPETIESGEYTPLSRPLFLYVNKAALERPEVREFLEYYMQRGQDLVAEVGYVRLGTADLSEAQQTLANAIQAATGGETASERSGAE